MSPGQKLYQAYQAIFFTDRTKWEVVALHARTQGEALPKV